MSPHKVRLSLRIVLAAAVVAAVGAVLAAGLRTQSSSGGAGMAALPVTQQLNKPVPTLTGKTLQGQPFDIDALRGRVVVINVMASWCAPCRAELPTLAAAAQRFAADDVRIVGLAMRDDTEDALALLRETDAERLTVIADPDGTRAVELGVRGVPETFVVDRSGNLRLHAFGPITGEWLDKHLRRLDST
ncbi:redoxin domain-containing protein [Mycobacterium sp. 852002-51961_SCH5331710]|uniref:TlpA family protein disulfide reductase n=1 Tax=Mycobacterium sp. 852002-51961_SCH5331710 TaxID=1834105 RepID=UPI0007FC4D96|nr:redoxin domain-containing protein [Mycobacterium sp. 852002-51961_SCH5331710]OBB35714.1 hypothetical protein A5752_19245 [Mycobacterium sp. 852002-51961_SCH5331710]